MEVATIVAEKPEHDAAIERVLDRAFGPGRFAKTSERVRERGARLELAHLAREGGRRTLFPRPARR
jgi:predicted N-acetyltransferase YhbS